jgi:hypothetical protein
MCYSIHQTQKIQKLCVSAQTIQALIDDGTLANALSSTDSDANHRVVTAFDVLSQNAGQVLNDVKDVSPFLRYRREALADGGPGRHLRALVLNLWGGRQGLDLSDLFMGADEHHTRVALEMIAGYTRQGERDPQFMALAAEIRDLEGEESERTLQCS